MPGVVSVVSVRVVEDCCYNWIRFNEGDPEALGVPVMTIADFISIFSAWVSICLIIESRSLDGTS